MAVTYYSRTLLDRRSLYYPVLMNILEGEILPGRLYNTQKECALREVLDSVGLE